MKNYNRDIPSSGRWGGRCVNNWCWQWSSSPRQVHVLFTCGQTECKFISIEIKYDCIIVRLQQLFSSRSSERAAGLFRNKWSQNMESMSSAIIKKKNIFKFFKAAKSRNIIMRLVAKTGIFFSFLRRFAGMILASILS